MPSTRSRKKSPLLALDDSSNPVAQSKPPPQPLQGQEQAQEEQQAPPPPHQQQSQQSSNVVAGTKRKWSGPGVSKSPKPGALQPSPKCSKPTNKNFFPDKFHYSIEELDVRPISTFTRRTDTYSSSHRKAPPPRLQVPLPNTFWRYPGYQGLASGEDGLDPRGLERLNHFNDGTEAISPCGCAKCEGERRVFGRARSDLHKPASNMWFAEKYARYDFDRGLPASFFGNIAAPRGSEGIASTTERPATDQGVCDYIPARRLAGTNLPGTNPFVDTPAANSGGVELRPFKPSNCKLRMLEPLPPLLPPRFPPKSPQCQHGLYMMKREFYESLDDLMVDMRRWGQRDQVWQECWRMLKVGKFELELRDYEDRAEQELMDRETEGDGLESVTEH